MRLIAPSILACDFSKLGEEIKAVEKAGCDWIHIDVMDGHFVPNITIGPLIVEAVRKVTKLPLDVHLMIENPDQYLEDFVKAGANWISVHMEGAVHLDRTLNRIRELGAKAAVALNPHTPVSTIEPVLELCDMVLLMSVNPGFGGQKFIPYTEKKIAELRLMIDTKFKPSPKGAEGEAPIRLGRLEGATRAPLIEVDGGIGPKNIEKLSKLGAEVFVAGSAIFGSSDYKKTIQDMK